MSTRRLSLEGLKDLSALADLRVGGAVSGLTRPDVALTRSGLGGPSDNLRRSSVPAFPRGTPPSGQPESITAGEGELIAFQASNKVPSRSMACIMTARRRASATRAFLRPRRFAIFSAQLFSAKLWRVRVRMEFAAS